MYKKGFRSLPLVAVALADAAYAGLGVQSIYTSGGTSLLDSLWMLICGVAALIFSLGASIAIFGSLIKFHEWVVEKYPNSSLLSFLSSPFVFPIVVGTLIVAMLK